MTKLGYSGGFLFLVKFRQEVDVFLSQICKIDAIFFPSFGQYKLVFVNFCTKFVRNIV